MSTDRKGVRLLLEPEVEIPDWIFENRTNAQCVVRQIKGRPLQVLTIPRGDAFFVQGGSVVISLPGLHYLIVGFSERTVLEIRHLSHGKDQRHTNYNLCKECMSLNSWIVRQIESSRQGYLNTTFRCSCGNEWTHRAI